VTDFRRKKQLDLLRDSRAAAHAAELVYVSPDEAGIQRISKGRSPSYVLPNGRTVRDRRVLERIAKLAIPPAWQEVWICKLADGHIQATGRDSRGRKQYRYHPRWRALRDEAKYGDIPRFAAGLPKLRKALARDLAAPHLSKAKVVATVLRLMEETHIRVGNDRYAETNGSYGLTTLLDQHARINGHHVEFRFRGKGGKPYRASVRDRRLAAIVKRCRDIPGQRLFQYVDERGHYRPISSTDVNEYLQREMGSAFTAKTFRTWAGTVGAALVLYEMPGFRSQSEARKNLLSAVDQVARGLGNTRAICRKCYVSPVVVDAYLSGVLHDELGRSLKQTRGKSRAGLRPEEAAVLSLFERVTTPRQRAA
jgi:DNA topoisomerase I